MFYMTGQDREDLKERRKQMFSDMEQKLKEMHTKEDDSLFVSIQPLFRWSKI